jgi:hypothetical protein
VSKVTLVQRIRSVSVVLTVGYLCIMLAGVAAIIAIPPATVTNSSNVFAGYVWSAFLVAGGALSASDMFTGRRGGELLGSPMLTVSLFLYGISILYRQWHTPGLASAGTVVAWLVLALCVFVFGRFMVVYMEARASQRLAEAKETG